MKPIIFHLSFILSFVVIFFQIVNANQEPCPKYPMCQRKHESEDCGGPTIEDCPGGRAACIRNPDTSEIVSCCCIRFDAKYKHLATGAVRAPLIPDKLRAYYMRFCPFSQRVMLTTWVKNLTVDDVYIHLKQKPEWYTPVFGGAVPVLELPRGIVNNDLVEVDYLDEEFVNPRKIHRSDPLDKAMDRQLAEKYNKVIPSGLFDILYVTGLTDPAKVPELIQKFENTLNEYANELVGRGTNFFGGNENPGYLDYVIWPWIERRQIFPAFYPNAYNYTQNSPVLEKWSEFMKGDAAVQEFLFSPEVHYEYAVSQRAGSPDYDMIAGF